MNYGEQLKNILKAKEEAAKTAELIKAERLQNHLKKERETFYSFLTVVAEDIFGAIRNNIVPTFKVKSYQAKSYVERSLKNDPNLREIWQFFIENMLENGLKVNIDYEDNSMGSDMVMIITVVPS